MGLLDAMDVTKHLPAFFRKIYSEMPTIIKPVSKKAGLPPGSLIHIGEKKQEETRITVLDYDEIHCEDREVTNIEECFPFKDTPTVTWINVDGIHDVQVLQKIGDHFGFHPLVLEDILNTAQRPKMDDFEDYLYVVLRMLYRDEEENIVSEQISLLLGNNYAISFQEQEGDVFTALRERIRNGKGRIRKMGADYLAYTLIDAIVDNYFIVLEKIGEETESLEEAVIGDPEPKTLAVIHAIKTEIVFFRKSVWPLREVISTLERGEPSLIAESTQIYLKDVYDHTIQVVDTIETFRDMLSGMLDIYLSSTSNKMNEVMKVLTIIATIFIPLSFVAGLYGMNFEYMPELKWHWGYFISLGVMFSIAGAMLVYFRRKNWI